MKNKKNLLDEVVSEQGFQKENFQILYFAYRPYSLRIVLSLLFGFLGRGLLLSNTNIIGAWVDQYCVPSATLLCRPTHPFWKGFTSIQFIELLAVITFFGFIFTLSFRWIFSRLSARAISQIHDETMFRVSRFPMSFFDHTPVGRIITRFSSDYGIVFRLFGGPLAEFLSIIFDLIWMVLLTVFASIWFFPLLVLIVFLNFLIWRLNKYKLREIRRELSASRSPSVSHFSETTQGVSTIRTFLKQESFSKRFSFLDRLYLSKKFKIQKQIIIFSLQMNGLTALLLFLAGLMGYFLTQSGMISIGAVGVAFAFITLSGVTTQVFFEWLAMFDEALIGVERLNEYIRMPLEEGAKLPVDRGFQTHHSVYTTEELKWIERDSLLKAKNASVEFKNVSLKYGPHLPFVLKNINFSIFPGEKFGIIGRTGSGKTSLIQALYYFYPLTAGKVLVNGLFPNVTLSRSEGTVALTDKNGIDLELYRRTLSSISQDSILFKATVRDNLDLTHKLSDAEIIYSLKQMGLHDWAHQSFLDVMIEEKGRNFSLGEKQLICLSRCLLENTPVVILDEATSSIDPRSEEIILRASEDFFGDKTQIIIAHRLTTIQKCDRILWLESGAVKAIGTPNEVLAQYERQRDSLTANSESKHG